MPKFLSSIFSIFLVLMFSACGGGGGGGSDDGDDALPAGQSNNANLASLSFAEGEISPTFLPTTNLYTSTIGNWIREVRVTASTEDPNATLFINADRTNNNVQSDPIPVSVGENDISITVNSEDGQTSQTYILRITRQEADEGDANLSSIVLSAGSLSPMFNKEVTDYTSALNSNVSSITVTTTPENGGSSISINGEVVSYGMPSAPIDINVGVNEINIVVVSANGANAKTYTIIVTKQGINDVTQQAYIKKQFTIDDHDFFGGAISIDNNRLAVGVHNDGIDGTLTGSVYIYRLVNDVWQFESYVKSPNPAVNDHFGTSVAIQGDLLVVGAPSEDSSATGVDGDQNDNSAPGSGAVYVYTRNGTDWQFQSYIKASNTNSSDAFGASVDLDGDVLAVGAFNENSDANTVNGDQLDNSAANAGAVYVFVRNNTSWIQNAYIKASNSNTSDQFGARLDVDGDTLVVSALGEDSNANTVNGDQSDNSASGSGAVYVYVRANDTWNQQAYIKSSNSEARDVFGISVSLDGDNLAIGARGESSSSTGIDGDQTNNSEESSGAVYLFERNINAWTQTSYIKASNAQTGDRFGETVGLANGLLVVGATKEDSNSTGIDGSQLNDDAMDSGAIYVFEKSINGWSQQHFVKASNTDLGDEFGGKITIKNRVFAVTSTREQGQISGINVNQGDNSLENAGAVYTFKAN